MVLYLKGGSLFGNHADNGLLAGLSCEKEEC